MKQIPLLKISLNLYHANMCWEPILEKVAVETTPPPGASQMPISAEKRHPDAKSTLRKTVMSRVSRVAR